MRTEAQKKADKKYISDTKKHMQLNTSYNGKDVYIATIVKQYCIDNGITINAYLKQLIESDLKQKGLL